MTQQLKRELGIFGAVMMGLGSIVGTGIFVSLGISAGITGASVLLAVMVAAAVATMNGLSSAQLAANHPVSGGTYEYGYYYLNPQIGFVAGWAFLLAKSASAATAALGFAGYFIDAFGLSLNLLVPLALAADVILTVIVLSNIRRSSAANVVIVSITLFTLTGFVVIGIFSVDISNLSPFFPAAEQGGIMSFFQACALMFVAYTGYGRIATLGEEVREPRRTIPRAIITTLLVTMVLYICVGFVAIGLLGAPQIGEVATTTAAPLEVAAQRTGFPALPQVIAIGAVTAMLGVLLNLLLGLSRVLLAMGRRRDMPPIVARLNKTQSTPYVAVILIGVLIGALVLLGDVRTTWTFSAFTVLIYYSITNWSALQLKAEERLFPRWISMLGLIACLSLAFFVPVRVWLIGLGLLLAGLVWQQIANRLFTD